MVGMNTADRLHHRATELVGAARAFHAGAEEPGSHAAAPDSLAALEEALQVLSAAWYQLAADASPGIVERRCGRGSEAPSWPRFDGVSREQEVRLMGTLHDVAAAFARCARACRDGRSTVGPIIARRVAGDDRRRLLDLRPPSSKHGAWPPEEVADEGAADWPAALAAELAFGATIARLGARRRVASLATWWRARDLDRGLARGADPMQSDELSLRVGQLGSAGRRARLARALREAVEVANGHQAPLRMPPPLLRRREVRENQELLMELADRVDSAVRSVSKAWR